MLNGFFQYPDLPAPVKNINVKVGVDNPDGNLDHTVVNISKGHIEFANDPFDFNVLIKNPISDLYVDAAAKGKLDLNNVTHFVKLPEGTQISGVINADASMSGSTNALKAKQYDKFNAKGTIGMNSFYYASKDYPTGVKVNSMLMTFNPKNVTLNLSLIHI